MTCRPTGSRRRAGPRADFLEQVPDDLRVGTVIFNHAVRSAEAPTTDRGEVAASIDSLRSSGGTATGDALDSSLRLLAASRRGDRRPPPAAIVLLSDGTSTHGRDPVPVARRARARHIPIYTVALGTDGGTIDVQRPDGSTSTQQVPPDRETLRELARLSKGRYYEAADGARARRGVRAPRLPGLDAARAARDHGRLRGRRGAAHAVRRGGVPALVRPASVTACSLEA